MLIDIEGRKINPKFVVEVTRPEKYIESIQKKEGLDIVDSFSFTGKYFISIFLSGVQPVNIICNSVEEANEKYDKWCSELNKKT